MLIYNHRRLYKMLINKNMIIQLFNMLINTQLHVIPQKMNTVFNYAPINSIINWSIYYVEIAFNIIAKYGFNPIYCGLDLLYHDILLSQKRFVLSDIQIIL